jgi:hypothetical protein
MYSTQNLYQNDPQWKSYPLGNSSETIGGWGCLLTSVTMMLNGMGYNETPVTVNDKMKAAGGFQGAFFLPCVIPNVFPNAVYKDMQPCDSSPAPIDQIDAALAAGKPVIVQVDWNQDAGIQTHYVLIKDKVGDDYSLYDPYQYPGDGPTKDVLLTQRYHFQGSTLAEAISAVLWFDSGNSEPPVPPAPKDVPADSFTVYGTIDNLALRASPSITGNLLKRMINGVDLITIEPSSSARAKIGQNNQWLNVQDPVGDQGFVAAWYVTDQSGTQAGAATTDSSSSSASTTAPSSTSVPAGSLALVPTQEVAFRSQPVIADTTLIRRVPVTEQLVSLEPASQAIAKIGVSGQWINVRDMNNVAGYVAAWYVKYASGSTAASAATANPPAPGATLVVKATADGIALRTQPIVSDSTLIQRLPLGTQFTVTEPNGASKIGQNNQWLQVIDPSGRSGYVAAWFVAL